MTHSRATCPMCDEPAGEPLLAFADVPALCHNQPANAAQARSVPRGRIDLVCCERCGHIYNASFDPALLHYDTGYNNELHYSPRFRRYADGLVERLATEIDLCGRHVIEIGCGQGEFLRQLCRRAGCRGTGYDPALHTGTEGWDDSGIRLVRSDFRPDPASLYADLIVCRHVLEHLPEPRRFLQDASAVLCRDRVSWLYVELPSADYMLRAGSLWDILYEHVSYFRARALHALLRSCGLEVREMTEAFNGQFLAALATPAADSIPVRQLHGTRDGFDDVAAFAVAAHKQLDLWRTRMAAWRAAGTQVAVWGAGTKGVMFLNHMATAGESVQIVDINPLKQGRFVVGTGHQIVAPQALRRTRPDVVLAMNPNYAGEIEKELASLALFPEILCP